MTRRHLQPRKCKCGEWFTPNTKVHRVCPQCRMATKGGVLPKDMPSIPIDVLNRLERGDAKAEQEAMAIQLAAVNYLRAKNGLAAIAAFDGSDAARSTEQRGETVSANLAMDRRVVRKSLGRNSRWE